MLEYINKVLVPYFTQISQKLELAMYHPALALFNVFKAHRCDIVLEKLRQNHIHQVCIPAGCTGELQPLDVSVNEKFKASMKVHFACWYSTEVKQSLDQGLEVTNIQIDLQASVLKPLHGNWLIMDISSLKDKIEVIQREIFRSGIMEYVSKLTVLFHHFSKTFSCICKCTR